MSHFTQFLRPLTVMAAAAFLCAAAPTKAPSTPSTPPPPVVGYLGTAQVPHIADWLPQPPQPGSADEAADIADHFATRAALTGPEGAQAAADDVYTPERVAGRYAEALGAALTPEKQPAFFAMMVRVHADADTMMAPVKHSVADGGRVRPFVRFPGGPMCRITYPGIGETGSYPSGHATIGWTWSLLLAEMAPDRADALYRKGVAFGQSRVICGYHWPSDVAAGRLEASALVARLDADPGFRRDFARARAEVDAARGVAPAPGPVPSAIEFLKRKVAGRPRH